MTPVPPLVSVITASFNAADFIEQTISSVLSQSFQNLEYIIIDGGSRDGTVEIIRKYESSLVYWHSKPDRGLAHAFNLGLSQAHGAWILYLNADDYFFDRQAVESMVPHLLENRDADVVFGQVALTPRNDVNSVSFPAIYGGPWRWKEFRLICTIPHQAAFTRREFFDRVGRFDESWRIAVDYEHYLRAGPTLAAWFIPQKVSVMRAGGLSLSNLLPSLKEWKKAQIAHKSTNPFLVWGNYIARYFWCAVKGRFSRRRR